MATDSRQSSARPQGVLASPLFSEEHLGEILKSLVTVPSVNGVHPETAIATEIERYLAETDCTVERVNVAKDRPSIGATFAGRGGPSLVLNGHTDTAPIDDPHLWSVEPFGGAIDGGWLYGRGATDMKAGLAVQIAVAQFLSAGRYRLGGSLVLHFAMGEERGEPGTLALLESGFVGQWGITTEPTGLDIGIGSRGLVTFRVRLHGKSAHAAEPASGENPIALLAQLLELLDREQRLLQTRIHPLLGSASVTPTVVRGGLMPSVIPDYCDVLVDRRLLPGEEPTDVLEGLRAAAGAVFGSSSTVTIEDGEGVCEAWLTPGGSELAERLSASISEVTGDSPELIATPWSSDARNLANDSGIETVVFGPGQLTMMHCVNERVELHEVRQAALSLALFALDFLT